MTTMEVRLVPVEIQPGEMLQLGVFERPVLVLDQENPQLYLGRNHRTGIDDLWVHRRTAVLGLVDGKVRLQLCPQRRGNISSSISINGRSPQWKNADSVLNEEEAGDEDQGQMMMELNHGDVITMEGRQEPPLRYSYQVVIGPTNEDIPPVPDASLTATASFASASTTAASSPPTPSYAPLGDETMCAVCMEIIVQCHVLVPCGHSFCKTCITPTPPSCPICRVPVNAQVPSLLVDNIVWEMVERSLASEHQGNCFYDKEDTEQYLQRTGKKVTKASQQNQSPQPPPARHVYRDAPQQTPQTRGKGRKRRRTQQHEQGNSVENAICLE